MKQKKYEENWTKGNACVFIDVMLIETRLGLGWIRVGLRIIRARVRVRVKKNMKKMEPRAMLVCLFMLC